MKSNEIIEIVAYNLANNECTPLLISDAIESLNRAQLALHNETVMNLIWEGSK